MHILEFEYKIIKGVELLTCGIYLLKNKVTGQLYIGQSKNIEERFRSHIYNKQGPPIDRSIRKYGHRRFMFNILCECEQFELNDKEKEYVKLYNTYEDDYHFNEQPGGAGFKNFYRINRKYDKWVLVAPGSRKLKSSKNKEELEILADNLNKKLITENDLYESKRYHVTKAGIKNNKQQYILVTPDNVPLKYSNNLELLNNHAHDLNQHIISELDVLCKKYRVIKDGRREGHQTYSIKNTHGKKIKNSVFKEVLEELVTKLNQNEISEEDLNIKPLFKIVKNGKSNGRQRYSIKNNEGKILKSSTDYNKLNNLISELMKEE